MLINLNNYILKNDYTITYLIKYYEMLELNKHIHLYKKLIFKIKLTSIMPLNISTGSVRSVRACIESSLTGAHNFFIKFNIN